MANVQPVTNLQPDQINQYIVENLDDIIKIPLNDLIVMGYMSIPVTRETIPFFRRIARKISPKVEKLYSKPNLGWTVFRDDVAMVYDNPAKLLVIVVGKTTKWTSWFPNENKYIIITNHRDTLEILETNSFEGVFFQTISLEGSKIQIFISVSIDNNFIGPLNYIYQNNRQITDALWKKLADDNNLLEITKFPQYMSIYPITECFRGFLWVNYQNELTFLGKIFTEKGIEIVGDVFQANQSLPVLSSLTLNSFSWKLRGF